MNKVLSLTLLQAIYCFQQFFLLLDLLRDGLFLLLACPLLVFDRLLQLFDRFEK